MDLLIRTLKANKYNTKWVMNITDVGHLTSDSDEGEDKLEKGARREGKTAWEVAEYYTKEFLDGMNQLNILTPDKIVKATDHIKEQIELIQILVDKGYGYLIADGVYYDTSKFESYKEFARLDLDEQQEGARVASNPDKRNPTDFALWKLSPANSHRDMEWDSAWGKGFPGWHIECSAMSMKFLGQTIDIHTGGIDHIPVHHTNEIAQSEAASGKRFANYWMHSNHITINEQKISKSLGNGISLADVIDRGFSPEVLRLHVLESHYQSQSKFSWESLQAAKNRLSELYAMAVLKYQLIENVDKKPDVNISDVAKEIKKHMSNNLDTPQVVAYLSRVANELLTSGIDNSMIEDFKAMLSDIDRYLGLKLGLISDIDDATKLLIKEREQYRVEQNWDKADELRKKLEDKNILIKDKPRYSQWQWTS
jgi:cysteinyl-tRNA synthetase